jgi:hypothetical protein
MAGQWRVRLSGTRREAVDIDLLVQAVVALGRQLAREQHISLEGSGLSDPTDISQEGTESWSSPLL